MAKPVQKHHVVDSYDVMWMDIRSGACEGKQNGRQVHQYGCDSNSVAWQRGCFLKKTKTKTLRLKSRDCSAEAIRRSSWQIRLCLEKSNWTHTYAHTLATVTLRRMRAEG